MTAKLIKGAEVAAQIREELAQEIADLKAKHNVIPGLVTVLVGADPASQVYVGAKEKTSKELGIYSERYDLPADTSQEDLMALIDKLNKDPKINGILVQLPLPKGLNEEEVLIAIDPKKDVGRPLVRPTTRKLGREASWHWGGRLGSACWMRRGADAPFPTSAEARQRRRATTAARAAEGTREAAAKVAVKEEGPGTFLDPQASRGMRGPT